MPPDELAEALARANDAIRLGSDNAVALSRAAHALIYLGNEYDRAVALAEQARSLNPNLAAVWHTRGWINIMCSDGHQVIESFTQLLGISPVDPTRHLTWQGLAWAHCFVDQYEEAYDWALEGLGSAEVSECFHVGHNGCECNFGRSARPSKKCCGTAEANRSGVSHNAHPRNVPHSPGGFARANCRCAQSGGNTRINTTRVDSQIPGLADTERSRQGARELLAQKPDVIFAATNTSIAALEAEGSQIPTVFAMVSDPIGMHYIDSFAHPGRNVTGFTPFEPSLGGKWVSLLKEVAPDVVRVGLVYNPEPEQRGGVSSINRRGLKSDRYHFV